jgi:hypothetical protein
MDSKQFGLEYRQLAELSTMGEYKATWTHNDVLDYITYNL